jgi:hypothetical protein
MPGEGFRFCLIMFFAIFFMGGLLVAFSKRGGAFFVMEEEGVIQKLRYTNGTKWIPIQRFGFFL